MDASVIIFDEGLEGQVSLLIVITHIGKPSSNSGTGFGSPI